MSKKRLMKLACEAYPLRALTREFSGFVRACQVFGIEVYPREDSRGVIVRTSKLWVERFEDSQGALVWNIFDR